MAACLTVACAPRTMVLPAGPGTPMPDYLPVFAEATAACADVRTLTAELSLSGRVGDERLRGRVHAGFERPSAMRLEAVAPFGPPAFVLAARGATSVLLLPREGRVLEGAPAADVLGALTGVSLSPDDLQAILTGCIVPGPVPLGGVQYSEGWASIALEGGATMYVRRMDGGWRIAAGRRDGWRVEYPDWQGRFPSVIRLLAEKSATTVDLTAVVAQLETNIDVPAEAFRVDVPEDALPITLDELRSAGPLRTR